MRKQLWTLFLTAVCIAMLTALTASAEDLHLTAKSLPKGTYDAYYEAQIGVTGGQAPYRIEVTGGLPPGLSCNDTGRLSGTPAKAGIYQHIQVTVTDSLSAQITEEISCPISAKSIAFSASDVQHAYDAQPHKATVTPQDPSIALVQDVDFVVTYGDYSTTSVTEAGHYGMSVVMKNSNYRASSVSPSVMVITESDYNEISMSPVTAEYDGQPHSIEPTVVPAAVPYAVTYTGIDVNYPQSAQPPSEIGRYRVEARTTGINFANKTASAILTILAPAVDFTVSNTQTVYNGSAQTADLVCANPEAAGKYTVRYTNLSASYPDEKNLTAVTEAGTYRIEITFPDQDYRVGNMNADRIEVRQRTVDFAVSSMKPYTGSAQTADIVPSVQDFDQYTVTYDDLSTDEAEAYSDVTEPGEYAVSILLTETAQRSNKMADAADRIFTIVDDTITIDFANAGGTAVYSGSAQTADITPSIAGFSGYTVTYDNLATDETETDESVTDAGSYAMTLTVTADGYRKGTVEGSLVFVIEPMPAQFAVKPVKVYAGTPVQADITPPDGMTDAFTVTYDNTETIEMEADANISAVGTYRVMITASDNYTVSMDHDTVTVVAQYTVGYGNSPYGRIMRWDAAEEQKTAAKQFFAGNRRFSTEYLPPDANADIIYTADAWTEQSDPDCDETAVFVSELTDFVPDFSAYYNDGTEVPPEKITVTVKEIQVFDQPDIFGMDDPRLYGDAAVGSQEMNALADAAVVPGIYTAEYAYTDKDGSAVTVQSTVVVTGRVGDINLDGDVNAADANLLRKQTDAVTALSNTVYLYRICDVNADGTVNTDDAEAVANRFHQPLVTFYPSK